MVVVEVISYFTAACLTSTLKLPVGFTKVHILLTSLAAWECVKKHICRTGINPNSQQVDGDSDFTTHPSSWAPKVAA